MSHTKEPWRVEKWYLKLQPDGMYYCIRAKDFGEGTHTLIRCIKKEDATRIAACVNACANLPEPEKNIRELVAAARDVLDKRSRGIDIRFSLEDLEKALAPFKEKK